MIGSHRERAMKIVLLSLLGVVGLSAAVAAGFGPQNAPVRHVVVFKYKPGTTEAQIRQVTDGFRALRDKIPGITAFEHGVNNSPENLNQGFTHVYMVTFANAAARDAYLPHPEHKAFVSLLGPVLEQAFVVDYVPQ
jgi:hypothetical protein